MVNCLAVRPGSPRQVVFEIGMPFFAKRAEAGLTHATRSHPGRVLRSGSSTVGTGFFKRVSLDSLDPVSLKRDSS